MRRTIAALMLVLSLCHLQVTRAQNTGRLVLPNASLLRCPSSDCLQLWSAPAESNDVFPKQLIVDTDHGCIYGITVLYDKSVPVDEIISAINALYKQWSIKELNNSGLHVWRVEPQRFSIQLAIAGKDDQKEKHC
jgi:hypothetical protein